jgi:cell division protein FtsW
MDRWLIATMLLLVGGGLFMVGKASSYLAIELGRSPSAFWWRHLAHLAIGALVLWAILSFRYSWLDRPWPVLVPLILCVVGLIAVRAMPSAGGSQRWLFLGPFRVQPSEFAKLAVVLFMAWLLSRDRERRRETASLALPGLALVALVAYLIGVEDLGSAVVLVVVAGVMAFMAGLNWKAIAVLVTLGAAAFAIAVTDEPYRWERLTAFLDPEADPFDSGFQLVQSKIAFGHGGIVGAGWGGDQQQAQFLPAAHTDFIFSIIGEELGMVCALFFLAAFLLLFWRGMRTAFGAPDHFGAYLALGLTSLLVLQALLNMCICLGLLPTTGLPLPFISYGGSSMVMSMAAMGLLLNVSQHAT